MAVTGLLSFIWLVVGVAFASAKYKGYSHINQFLSELGATGSPTQKLSPRINNFPLAVLFVAFGLYLALGNGLLAIGLLIIAHGIATGIAGVFSMDNDPYTQNPTVSGRVHALAGGIMFISLLIAQIFGLFFESMVLKGISLASLIFTLYFTYKLASSFKVRKKVGLWQRLSYGSQMLWLSALSINYIW